MGHRCRRWCQSCFLRARRPPLGGTEESWRRSLHAGIGELTHLAGSRTAVGSAGIGVVGTASTACPASLGAVAERRAWRERGHVVLDGLAAEVGAGRRSPGSTSPRRGAPAPAPRAGSMSAVVTCGATRRRASPSRRRTRSRLVRRRRRTQHGRQTASAARASAAATSGSACSRRGREQRVGSGQRIAAHLEAGEAHERRVEMAPGVGRGHLRRDPPGQRAGGHVRRDAAHSRDRGTSARPASRPRAGRCDRDHHTPAPPRRAARRERARHPSRSPPSGVEAPSQHGDRGCGPAVPQVQPAAGSWASIRGGPRVGHQPLGVLHTALGRSAARPGSHTASRCSAGTAPRRHHRARPAARPRRWTQSPVASRMPRRSGCGTRR